MLFFSFIIDYKILILLIINFNEILFYIFKKIIKIIFYFDKLFYYFIEFIKN